MSLKKYMCPLLQSSQHALIWVRSTSKIAVELNKEIQQQIESEQIKPRRHQGVYKTGVIHVPPHIVKGLLKSLGDHPVKTVLKDAQGFSRYLTARHPPPEASDLRKKMKEIELEVDTNFPTPDFQNISEDEFTIYKKQRDSKIKKILKQRTFAWTPMNYGQYEALIYAFGRSAQEYASIYKIFHELAIRDPDFKPRSYFDFGSGVGTGMWAASHFWKDSLFEYFNVDSSRDMNDLSDLILREGNENQQSCLKNVYYRQFLPASKTKYDIVLSAFSLFELPDSVSRKDVILSLWGKCDKYLIIVEQGTRLGFQLVDEAKQYILDLREEEDTAGHVFAPCPHDTVCPRISNMLDRTPCNFHISYGPLPIGDVPHHSSSLFSYVVLQKGKRDISKADSSWPRIVRPTLVRARHSICRTCTSKGTLQEIIFTASKHGKSTYQCARSSRWGDRLPVTVGERYDVKEEIE